jgi:hypothetical protein
MTNEARQKSNIIADELSCLNNKLLCMTNIEKVCRSKKGSWQRVSFSYTDTVGGNCGVELMNDEGKQSFDITMVPFIIGIFTTFLKNRIATLEEEFEKL